MKKSIRSVESSDIWPITVKVARKKKKERNPKINLKY